MSGTGSVRRIGRYAMYRELAAGGMATVHLGRLLGPAGFSRTVAIKSLHPHIAKDPDVVAMFLDEARLAARIQHPNVASTLDVVAIDGDVFLVMEYIHGETLARLIRAARDRGERVPVPIAVAVVAGVLLGLHAAHEAKSESGEPLDIVHRDVSPQNVLVGVDGGARLLDFGVAKAAERLRQTTRDGSVKGKLAYMAPEQFRGGHVNRQSDVYSASVVLWEALTGERLFEGDNEGVVIDKVLLGQVAPPSKHVAGLPSTLDAIVMRGLAREGYERFSTAQEMSLALLACDPATPTMVAEWVSALADDALSQRAGWIADIEGSTRGGPSNPMDAFAEIAASEPEPQAAPTSRRRAIVGATVALGLALVSFAGVRSLRATTPQATAAAVVPVVSIPPPEAPSSHDNIEPPPTVASTPPSAAAPKRATPPSVTRAACNPPYVLSPSGKKTYKRNCL